MKPRLGLIGERPRDGLAALEQLLPTVDNVRDEEIPAVIARLSGLIAGVASQIGVLSARLLVVQHDKRPGVRDRLLPRKEAARKLGMSEDWLKRNAGKYDFTVPVGGDSVRFSEQGMERWIRRGGDRQR